MADAIEMAEFGVVASPGRGPFPEYDPFFTNPTGLLQQPRYRSDYQIGLGEIEGRKNAPSLSEAAEIALEDNQLAGAMLRHARSVDLQPDPNFQWSKDLFAEVVRDVPYQYHSFVFGAVSEKHAYALADQAKRQAERDQKFGLLGWQGALLSIPAAILDPIAIGIGIVSGSTATPGLVALKSARLRRIVGYGAAFGLENAAIEAYISEFDPRRGADDVLIAGMFGMALGGLYGGVSRIRPDGRVPDVSGAPQNYVDEKISNYADQWLAQAQYYMGRAQLAARDGRPITHLTAARSIYDQANRNIDRIFQRGAVVGEVTDVGAFRRAVSEAKLIMMRAEIGEMRTDLPDQFGTIPDLARDLARKTDTTIDQWRNLAENVAALLLDVRKAGGPATKVDVVENVFVESAEIVLRDAIRRASPETASRLNMSDVQKVLAAGRDLTRKIEANTGATEKLARTRGALAEAGLRTMRMQRKYGDLLGLTHRWLLTPGRAIRLSDDFAELTYRPDFEADAIARRAEPLFQEAEQAANVRGAADMIQGGSGRLRERADAPRDLSMTPEEFQTDLNAALERLEFARRSASELKSDVAGAAQLEAQAKYAQDRLEGADRPTDGPDDSVGAMRAEREIDESELGATERRMLRAENAPYTWMGRIRFSFSGRLKSSRHPMIRSFGGLVEDVVGNADKSVIETPVSVKTTLDIKRFATRMAREIQPNFAKWAAARGYHLVDGHSLSRGTEFLEEVGAAVRRPKPDAATLAAMPDDLKAVHNLANSVRRWGREFVDWGREHNVPGFDELYYNDTWLPRMGNARKIDQAILKEGEGMVYHRVANAIQAAHDGQLDSDVADGLAKAWVTGMKRRRFPLENITRAVEGGDLEVLESLLKQQPGMSDALAQKIVSGVRKAKNDPDKGKIANARKRQRMDETMIEDLLESNVEELMHRYARSVYGEGHLQDFLRKFAFEKDGVLQVPSIETLKQDVWNTAGKYGVSEDHVNSRMKDVDVIVDMIRGIPLEERSQGNEILRLLRDYQFFRVMNQVGIAQVPELGVALSQGGFRESAQQIPELGNILKRAKSGTLSNEFLDELEVMFGPGTDRLRRSFSKNLDDYGASEDPIWTKTDTLFRRGKALTADFSGMPFINASLQRLTAALLGQRFVNLAFGTRRLTQGQLDRLANIGLSADDTNRILAKIRKHSLTVEGVFGRKVKRLNVDEWNDPELEAKFIEALHRESTRIIQENDIGQTRREFVTPLGRTLLQFRSFIIGSYEKHLLHGLHYRDAQTYAGWMLSTMLGGMAYIAQTQLNSAGREDREEYLEKRLSWEAIGAAAFQRTAYSSLLPGAIDTAMYPIGLDPVFGYSRTTGQASDFVSGSPVFGFVDDAQLAVRGLSTAAWDSDYDLSQKDVQRVQNLMPFANALGLRNSFYIATSGLPETSR